MFGELMPRLRSLFAGRPLAQGRPADNTGLVCSGGLVQFAAVPNACLANSSVTISGHALALGGGLTLAGADVGLGNVENTALSTWAGSTNVTTLGTITTGTVPWANVSKSGSSLADLATRSAGDLSSGTLPAARLPDMVAAGASHAHGAAPDPGATSHANVPYFLGDDAAWHPLKGGIIGSSYVNTSESTTSATNVDLTTVQSVTFSLDETTTVWVLAFAQGTDTLASAVIALWGNVDGATDFASQTVDTAGGQYPLVYCKQYSLASGSHTIKLQFSANAGTGSFSKRGLFIIRG